MRGSSLLPKRLREFGSGDSSHVGGLNRRVTKFLQSIAQRACTQPIHTIVVTALLASTSYVGLLDASLFDSAKAVSGGPGQVDVASLLEGGRNVRLGESTGWRWQVDDTSDQDDFEVRLYYMTYRRATETHSLPYRERFSCSAN
jgi:hydroxymethylglutaryl-CoA reductase (NADPH)